MSSTIRNIMTIAGKELRSYFASPVAWVLMGLFAILFGWFYNVYLNFFVSPMQQQFGPPPTKNVNSEMIRPLLQNASVLILFLLPMITMRTYSEEKRSGTIELLLTSPVTDVQIIVGKFVGAIGLYAGLLAVTFLYVTLALRVWIAGVEADSLGLPRAASARRVVSSRSGSSSRAPRRTRWSRARPASSCC